jgi:hypothetical protein
LAQLNTFLTSERLGALRKSDDARTLEATGTTPEAWFADLVDVSFLKVRVVVHKQLADRLARVESALSGQPEPAHGWLHGSVSGLRGPGNGLHSFGLAIDLNVETNPFIFKATSDEADPRQQGQNSVVRGIIDRAVLLVQGRSPSAESFDARPQVDDGRRDHPPSAAQVEASWEKLHEASSAMEEYLSLGSADRRDALQARVVALGDADPKHRSVEEWAAAIARDQARLKTIGPAKQWKPEHGFLDLDKRLVLAMAAEGLTWLGDDTIGSGRDIMHFDTRGVGPIRRVFSSATNGFTNL